MDILKRCGNKFRSTKIAQSCDTDYIGKPYILCIISENSEVTAIGKNPTPAEAQAHANIHELVFLKLGLVSYPDGTPIFIEADANQDGLKIKIGEDKVLTGYVTNLNQKVTEMLGDINTNKKVAQVAFITKDGRWFGGKKGWKASVSISSEADNGGGENAVMRMKVEVNFKIPQNQSTDYTDVDTDYLLLDNAENIGVYTLAGDASKDSISGYEGVTNWDKSLYPTLYAEVTTTTVDYYISAAHRTAQTPKYFSINTLVNGNVIAGTGAGLNLGGFVDIISANFVAGDEFTVAYS